jgi:hypothetical protein
MLDYLNAADEWSDFGIQDGDDAFQWLQQQGMQNRIPTQERKKLASSCLACTVLFVPLNR